LIVFVARYVLKFGGTSVANVARIEHAADIVSRVAHLKNEVVVVVSAMAGMTNQLVSYAEGLSPGQITPEHDTVISSGEQITAGLMALALQKRGFASRSFLSFQVPIETNDDFTQGRITHICPAALNTCLSQKIIPVVAGFQGITKDGRITTLGRGGSDTTAVAIAAALKADFCDIYTDVEGVYTADPRIVPLARKIDILSYPEMIELAAQGAKVLQARSVEMGMRHNVNLRVLSSFVNVSGTTIVYERKAMEGLSVSGIAHNLNEAKITLDGVKDEVGMAAQIFGALAKERIPVDMILQSFTQDGRSNVTFTINKSDVERIVPMLDALKAQMGFTGAAINRDIVKISVIGVGIRSNLDIASLVFKTLADHNINIQLISTSEIKLSVVIANDQMTKAMCALHNALLLDDKNEETTSDTKESLAKRV
jgi:aspartate kinase